MQNENKKIRVMIVDDSFFMRKLLRKILEADPAVEVVGEAQDGVSAIGESTYLKPDVITMDYKMPRMTGAESTAEILKNKDYQPVIIIISSFTKKDAEETVKCLAAGALDYVLYIAS